METRFDSYNALAMNFRHLLQRGMESGAGEWNGFGLPNIQLQGIFALFLDVRQTVRQSSGEIKGGAVNVKSMGIGMKFL